MICFVSPLTDKVKPIPDKTGKSPTLPNTGAPLKNIAIELKAFEVFGQKATSFDFTLPADTAAQTDLEICEAIYRQTHGCTGELWDAIAPALPTECSHSSLSLGDDVIIDGRRYRFHVTGFKPISA
jgi:hypothetical protein